MDPKDALASLDQYRSLDSSVRLELAFNLAEQLGEDWEAHDFVGDAELATLRHLPTNMLFVAIPGGSFEMGLSDADLEEARRYIDDQYVEHHLKLEGDWARPVHTVSVAPFLLGMDITMPKQVRVLSDGAFRGESFVPAKALEFAQVVGAFRLPSEAEFEWVMREGGAVRFVADAARQFAETGRWPFPHTNGWGFKRLNANAWTADEWHDSYEGAPSTGEAWTSGGPPGVFRGDLPVGVEYPAALTAALAAYRGRWVDGQENEVVIRLARSLS